jgi:2-dehydro-3-deoxyphosphogluconate aldolase/(4S)-4-hydroxy-2-oxoglutarate aldolase
MPTIPEILSKILDRRLIAVLRLDSDREVIEICEALLEGGIDIIEVTMTTPGALGAIEKLARRGDLRVGAGTVLDPQTARRAFDAGALFFASPIADPATIETARIAGVVSMPGASTPTEIHSADRAGADLIKLFPMPADGVRALKTLRSVFPSLLFAPSGGVSDTTAAELLAAGAAALNVGTWLTHEADGTRSPASVISERARSLVREV